MIAENTKYTLPEGWIWTTLDLVSKNITDGSHNPPGKQDSGIPMLSARNIENGKITFDEVRYISESDYAYENQRARIEAGDVLLTIVATIGRSAIISTPIQQRFALQRSVAAIKPLINGFFLMYVFQSPEFQKLLTDNAKGTGQKGVYLKTLRELPIPLPPLPEQYRIVAKIEELFSELDHAEVELKKSQKQLKVYRQAMLKSAFEGKMTEKWRIENSVSLSDWYNVNLGDIVTIIRGASPRPAGDRRFFGGNIPWITVGEITKDEKKILTKVSTFLTEIGKKHSRFIEKGTLLLTNSGATLGVPKISMIDGCINDGSVAFPDIANEILKNYLYWFLNSQTKILRQINQGAGQPNLNTQIVKDIIVPYPSSYEQVQIVQELETRFTLIENLENSIDDGLRKIGLFRQSILRRAFEGKLVPQDKNDKPATTLLKLISQEKETYMLNQKMISKGKPIKKKPMEKRKTIKEILGESKNPINSERLWRESIHCDNIEEFYAELKKMEHEIEILFEGKESSIFLKI